MTHEKIFSRGDKGRIKVIVKFHLGTKGCYWEFEVSTCEPRKRTWKPVVDRDSSEFKNSGWVDRLYMAQQQHLRVATSAEVQEVMLEFWEKLKPTAPILQQGQ